MYFFQFPFGALILKLKNCSLEFGRSERTLQSWRMCAKKKQRARKSNSINSLRIIFQVAEVRNGAHRAPPAAFISKSNSQAGSAAALLGTYIYGRRKGRAFNPSPLGCQPVIGGRVRGKKQSGPPRHLPVRCHRVGRVGKRPPGGKKRCRNENHRQLLGQADFSTRARRRERLARTWCCHLQGRLPNSMIWSPLNRCPLIYYYSGLRHQYQADTINSRRNRYFTDL